VITEVVLYWRALKNTAEDHSAEAIAVQNFHKLLQACTDKAAGHFEHFI